jgi:cobalt-zinc-cadmium efflux system outer membrane protein
MNSPNIDLSSRANHRTASGHSNLPSLRRGVFFALLWAGLILSWSAHASIPVWEGAPLADLVDEGLRNNKELQSLEAQLKSQRQEVSVAGSLDDPRIGVGILNLPVDSFSFSQEPMTQKQISIAQRIPWFGKRSLRSQLETQKVLRQMALIDAKKAELVSKIAAAYYELGFVAESVAVNEKMSALVDQLLRVAETKYSSGEGLQQDVLQAQVERSTLLEEKIVLEKNRRLLEDTINELLNRNTFATITLPANFSFPALELDLDSLKAQSLLTNPQVQMRQAELAEARVEVELAQKDYLPNMDVMAAYGQREEDAAGRNLPDFVSASLSFNIPLWYKSRQRPKLDSTRKKHEAAEKMYANLIETLPHQVDGLVTEIRNNQQNYKLYDEALVLQAEQWARSALSGYEVGKVGFDVMINAQLRLLRLKLKEKRFLFNIYQKRVQLGELLGEALPPEQPSASGNN